MNIAVIGTGYVGLTVGICLASKGHEITCVDKNDERVRVLNKGAMPIHEPGLRELLKVSNVKFSTDIERAVSQSEICFVTVGTPQNEDGSADLNCITEAVSQIAKAANGYKIVVIKSTVPPGTALKLHSIMQKLSNYPFDIVSNPEFLRQGVAVNDFLHPDRIIIGCENKKAARTIGKVYSLISKRVYYMDNTSAELVKCASNSFLATRISFINEIYNLCKRVGGDIDKVVEGMGADHRIGWGFFSPGIGYGGSCFPKDVRALIQVGKDYSCNMSILKAVDKANEKQKQMFLNKIYRRFGKSLRGRIFTVWGLTFKAGTDDLREAPSLTVVNELIKRGATVKVYDPLMNNSFKDHFKGAIFSEDKESSLADTSALIILTDWYGFSVNLNDYNIPVIFDGRRVFSASYAKAMGVEYHD